MPRLWPWIANRHSFPPLRQAPRKLTVPKPCKATLSMRKVTLFRAKATVFGRKATELAVFRSGPCQCVNPTPQADL